jgi:hypothetical protein
MQRLVHNPIFVFVAFWGVLWMLLRLHLAFAFTGLFLPFVLAMSVFAMVKMIRKRNFSPYGATALISDVWRRWILDEREENKPVR